MSESKQPQLNGAYYGPSIPPQSKSYHRPGRGGGSSCNPFTCCCNCICGCIFNCIFQIILTFLIAVGIVIFVLWLLFRPSKVKFYATDASLTQFEYSTTNSTLYYNLALNMTIRNPNKRIGIYYDSIEARALYQGQRFASVQLDPFYQRKKNSSTLHPVFQGQNLVLLGTNEVSKYNEDKNSSIYRIDIKLYLRARFKFAVLKSPKVKPTIECDLHIPLDSNGKSSGTFESTRCRLDW